MDGMTILFGVVHRRPLHPRRRLVGDNKVSIDAAAVCVSPLKATTPPANIRKSKKRGEEDEYFFRIPYLNVNKNTERGEPSQSVILPPHTLSQIRPWRRLQRRLPPVAMAMNAPCLTRPKIRRRTAMSRAGMAPRILIIPSTGLGERVLDMSLLCPFYPW